MSGTLPLHHRHLWVLDQADYPCGSPPMGDLMLQLWAQRWACCRVAVGGGLPGPDHGPLPVLRCW